MDRIRCTKCGTVLEGGTYHNMTWCKCKAVAYDWHDLWPRIAFKDAANVEVWNEKAGCWKPLEVAQK